MSIIINTEIIIIYWSHWKTTLLYYSPLVSFVVGSCRYWSTPDKFERRLSPTLRCRASTSCPASGDCSFWPFSVVIKNLSAISAVRRFASLLQSASTVTFTGCRPETNWLICSESSSENVNLCFMSMSDFKTQSFNIWNRSSMAYKLLQRVLQSSNSDSSLPHSAVT